MAIQIIKPPGLAEWAARQCDDKCTFQYSEENTAYANYFSVRGLTAGDHFTYAAQDKGLKGATRWDKITQKIGGQTCSNDEIVIDNERMATYSGSKDSVNCILKDIETPRLANFTFKVLPIAMNDEDCPTLECIPMGSPDDATSQSHITNGYGAGEVHHGFCRLFRNISKKMEKTDPTRIP